VSTQFQLRRKVIAPTVSLGRTFPGLLFVGPKVQLKGIDFVLGPRYRESEGEQTVCRVFLDMFYVCGQDHFDERVPFGRGSCIKSGIVREEQISNRPTKATEVSVVEVPGHHL